MESPYASNDSPNKSLLLISFTNNNTGDDGFLPRDDTMDSNTLTTAPNNCTNDYCVSDEEYLDMIQDFIFPDWFEWILIVMYFYVFVMGLVGNFFVCFAVVRNRHMRTITNYFIVNLAAADFLVILICLPPTVLEDVTETWYMGKIMCKTVKYLQVSQLILCLYWGCNEYVY